jgi:hypothetical protein
MDAKDDGLTLGGLAQRLETLEHENERMRSENADLRHKVAAPSGSKTSQAVEPTFEGRVSRRALLSKAGAAAVAAVAAGTLLYPREAEAHSTTNIINAESVNAHWIRVVPHDTSLGNGIQSQVDNNLYAAVKGDNFGFGPGVWGQNLGSAGDEGPGVEGLGRPGVKGRGMDSSSHGVEGEGLAGVVGKSSTTGFEGVYGQHTGSLGFGVVGDGTGAAGAGILGRNSGGDGVQGEGANGVHGKATGGYGGLFEGGKAQLRITPKGTAGRPTTGAHSKGELYMDSAAALFVCTASGTPGKWRKVTTTAV